MAVNKKKKNKKKNNINKKKNYSNKSKQGNNKSNKKKYSNKNNKNSKRKQEIIQINNKNYNCNKNKSDKNSLDNIGSNNIQDIHNNDDSIKIEINNTVNNGENNFDEIDIIVEDNGKIDLGNEIDDSVIDKDDNISNRKFNIRNMMGLFLFIFILLLFMGWVFYPRFELDGDKIIVISYNDSYVEPGYSVSINKHDVSSDVKIDSNVNLGVVGEYKIRYYIDKFGVRFNKYRDVIIVDNDNPRIEIEHDVINICPKSEVPDVKYSAIDEYDGDITTLVYKKIMDDKILLKVKDSSDNETEVSIKIDRSDKEEPVIKLNGDSVMFLEYGKKYVEPGYSVSDNCSSNLDDSVIVSGSVGRDIGNYKIKYEVIDESGNKSSVTRKVIVGNKINDSGVVHNGVIYLTFDDGPNEGTTNKILDILKDEGVKATFFVTGNGPDYLIKRIYNEGHTIALHTASHDYSYIYSSIDNYFDDLNRVSDRVKRLTGVDSKIIRFPGGSSNVVSKNYRKGIMTELTQIVVNDGYRYFDWNVDGKDASTSKSSQDVYYNVTSTLSINRANVVLLHDIKSITVGALRDIIKYGKENGYQFMGIDMNTKMVRHGVSN